MPIHQLQRRDSWPPTQVRIGDLDPSRQELETVIDENPFAFFLTSPDELALDDLDDIDDYLSSDELNAGIETPDSAKSPVREVSPSSLQRHPLPEEEIDDEIDEDGDDEEEDFDFGFGLAIPMSLKDFTNATSSGRKSRTAIRNKSREEELHGLGISLGEFAARGRAKVRLVPARRPLRQSRSLSARRPPQSWRAPSPEIFSIREERESDEEEKKEGGDLAVKVSEEIYSASAPASTQLGGIMASPGLKPKEKKRVHWAL
ncbi:hypothetical protein EG329_005269 [Mollisiaceae sp. DMI_Dod_QoI]|nr:hypothetical protein EG329_005269 [Helotiales sp. DMI_Dod_QoI]